MSTEHYQGDEFPIHIDLGVERPDYGVSAPGQDAPKKGKKSMDYPTLYIRGVAGLKDLPKDGCALIEFHRNKISMDTPEGEQDDGESAELTIKTLCLMDNAGSGDGEDLKTAMAKGMKDAGVDTEGYEGNSDDEETEGEE